jgi:AhpD family alkylhydroperoxidase
VRIGYAVARRRFGKVPTPFKVAYARAPKLAAISFRVARVLERGLSLDPALVQLVMLRSSQMNGCGFCADLHLAEAVRGRLGVEKFRALDAWRDSPAFTEPERAALAYCEEITRNRTVTDATFAELAKHFGEKQIVELTWVNAIGNFFNLMAVPLGLESDGLAELALRRAS